MLYFKNENDEVFGYEEETQSDLIEKAMEKGWEDVTDSWPPAPEEADPSVVAAQEARILLSKSDVTLLRCLESGVEIPSDWVTYRTQLRSVVSGETSIVPSTPDYPSGT